MFLAGLAASDAPETRGLVAQIQQLKASNGISLYIDFHSYGQYILWGKLHGYEPLPCLLFPLIRACYAAIFSSNIF